MAKKYEYQFIKTERSWWGGLFFKKDDKGYQEIIEEQGRNGWRLSQMFAPSSSVGSQWCELIFEREIN